MNLRTEGLKERGQNGIRDEREEGLERGKNRGGDRIRKIPFYF